MPNERALLEHYVQAGKLMQLASLNSDGSPAVCSVWYDAHFAPDVLRFISRYNRQHSQNVRMDSRVTGSIIAVPIEGLGQTVRGVTFTGVAHELPICGIDEEVTAFVARWPRAEAALRPEKIAHGEIPAASMRSRSPNGCFLTRKTFPSSHAELWRLRGGGDDGGISCNKSRGR